MVCGVPWASETARRSLASRRAAGGWDWGARRRGRAPLARSLTRGYCTSLLDACGAFSHTPRWSAEREEGLTVGASISPVHVRGCRCEATR